MTERRRLALFVALLLIVFLTADLLNWPTPFGPENDWNAR